MYKLKRLYSKVSKQTQNRIQEIFDTLDINYENLYDVTSRKNKQRVDTYIEEWEAKGLLKGYFGTLAYNIYRRNRVKNIEILELLIYSAYIEEQDKIENQELNIFRDVANYYYQEGQEEVEPKRKKYSVIPDAIFLALLDMANSKGQTYELYIQSTLRYNTEQILKQATINLQQQNDLKIDSDDFQKIIQRQQNLKLNINGDKISGDIDLTLIGINNNAKLEGISLLDKEAEVEVVVVEDEVTTKMCHSLSGQKFKVHDWNEFSRYSKANDTIKKYKCYGLITGLNCPPINDGFHWCRSYIKYVSKNTLLSKNNVFSSKIEKVFENKYDINKARIKGIDINVLYDIFDNMEKVYNDFPQLIGKIKEIQTIEHPYGGINITPDITDNKYIVQINKNKFNSIENCEQQYVQNLKKGFHPKGTTYKDMGNHELGHSAIYEIIRKNKTRENDIINDWNNNITAEEITQKAFKNLGIDDKLTQDMLRKNISTYAMTDYGETIGEAFADYYANREKSKILSKEIIKVMKGML